MEGRFRKVLVSTEKANNSFKERFKCDFTGILDNSTMMVYTSPITVDLLKYFGAEVVDIQKIKKGAGESEG